MALAIFAAAAALGGVGVRAQNSNAPAWDPSVPLPKFITHFVIDPKFLVAISKYRSNAGHAYSDDYEWPDSSMKNYYQPLPQYLFGQNGQNTLPEYAPASGTVVSVSPDGPLSTGEPRGNQIAIVPDGYPQFTIVLFHCDSLASVVAGGHVNAGDQLGYADLREAINIDVAVSANWNATPMFVSPGTLPAPGQVLKAPGWRLLSPFDVMSDGAFAIYAPYGLTDRSTMTVPLAYRNQYPGQFAQWDPANLDPIEAFIFPVPPVIATQPRSPDVAPGGTAQFFVFYDPTGTIPTYQWYRNGVAIPGATDYTYTINSTQASDAGFYSVVLTTPGGSVSSYGAALTVMPQDLGYTYTSRLVNISTRAKVLPGGRLTAGFVMNGDGAKPLLVRAVGPGLSPFGVAGALPSPTLSLIPAGSSTSLLSSSNWIETATVDAATAAVGAFPLTPGSADAAATKALIPGAYTMVVAPSKASDTGIALAEVYDADPGPTPTAKLINVSSLGYSGPGADVMIVGFVVTGTTPKHLLIRAVGPGLTKYGVTNVMSDPQLFVFPHGVNTPPLYNDNWGDDGMTQIVQGDSISAGAFPLDQGSKDAALDVYLPAGSYTVQAMSTDGTGGTVLVEVYDLGP